MPVRRGVPDERRLGEVLYFDAARGLRGELRERALAEVLTRDGPVRALEFERKRLDGEPPLVRRGDALERERGLVAVGEAATTDGDIPLEDLD